MTMTQLSSVCADAKQAPLQHCILGSLPPKAIVTGLKKCKWASVRFPYSREIMDTARSLCSADTALCLCESGSLLQCSASCWKPQLYENFLRENIMNKNNNILCVIALIFARSLFIFHNYTWAYRVHIISPLKQIQLRNSKLLFFTFLIYLHMFNVQYTVWMYISACP